MSFEQVKRKWVPEAHHHCPGTPFVLVATQIDLRADEEAMERMARGGKLVVSMHQGQRMAREVGATKYLECSAKTLEGIKDVFDQVSTCTMMNSQLWRVVARADYLSGYRCGRCAEEQGGKDSEKVYRSVDIRLRE
jgi:GTPase SAR1 family protein